MSCKLLRNQNGEPVTGPHQNHRANLLYFLKRGSYFTVCHKTYITGLVAECFSPDNRLQRQLALR